jgi:iron complex outermembrane receptor protein
MRAAAGINGEAGGWTYQADLSAVRSDLDVLARGLINIPGVVRAINTGSYNFRDPRLNSDAVRRQISPDVLTTARSELYLAQAVASRELLQLPGGPLQIGLGGQFRREILDQPNQNANQQTIGLNQYSASGRRNVWAAFGEVSAPLFRGLELTLSGRYDNYSTGFDSFSPRVGVKFTPIPQLALRGTYSRGFRAPSFAESTQGSVVGYTATNPGNVFSNVCTSHGGTYNEGTGRCTGGSPYVGAQSIGFNSASNPDLGPERSRNFTLGAIVQPAPWISFTVDYYNIRKTDVITGGPLSNLAIANYYAGLPLPAGYTVTLNAADPLHPNAIRTIAQVNSPYENASELATDGIDFSLLMTFRTESGVRLTSQLEATRILNYTFVPGEGQPRQSYVGTQGPFITSSGAGTPAWRANWSNSIEAGPVTFTGTLYYTSGYRSVAEDQNGAGANTCADALYGSAFCETSEYIQADFVASYRVNDNFTFYANLINAFDAEAPINPANYAATNYNPTYSQGGAVGRMFRVGANIRF